MKPAGQIATMAPLGIGGPLEAQQRDVAPLAEPLQLRQDLPGVERGEPVKIQAAIFLRADRIEPRAR
jgi:hypothetical protein